MNRNKLRELQRRAGAAKGRLHQSLLANQKAEAVRDFVEPLANQGYSLQYIADWLNSRRVIGPRGGQWTRKSVHRLFERLDLRKSKAA